MAKTFWVIKHKPTGELMPLMKRNKGYTHWRPGNPDDKLYQISVPRLFSKKAYAKAAINWWLKGKTSMHVYRDSFSFDCDVEISTAQVPNRKADDLEIVPVNLVSLRKLAKLGARTCGPSNEKQRKELDTFTALQLATTLFLLAVLCGILGFIVAQSVDILGLSVVTLENWCMRLM